MRLVQCWAWSEVRLMHRPRGRLRGSHLASARAPSRRRRPITRRARARQPATTSPPGAAGLGLELVAVGLELVLGGLELLGALARLDVADDRDQLLGVLRARRVGGCAERAGESVQPADHLRMRVL